MYKGKLEELEELKKENKTIDKNTWEHFLENL